MGAIKARCALAGCPNFAAGKSSLCVVHKRHVAGGGAGDEAETFGERVAREDAEHRAAGAAEFRERLASGRYGDLLGERLGGMVAEAAQVAGVGDELGILRVLQAQVLVQIPDLETKVKLLCRLHNTIFAAAKVQRLINGQLADGLTDAITSILLELDGEGAA